MINIEEINPNKISDFWEEHIKYLVEDGIIDDEDYDYFISDEYRGVIAQHMQRGVDKHHLVYFTENGQKIGACSYCIIKAKMGSVLF